MSETREKQLEQCGNLGEQFTIYKRSMDDTHRNKRDVVYLDGRAMNELDRRAKAINTLTEGNATLRSQLAEAERKILCHENELRNTVARAEAAEQERDAIYKFCEGQLEMRQGKTFTADSYYRGIEITALAVLATKHSTSAAPEAESEKEESRTVPPAPVLLPAEPPKNPDGPAAPEPQAAEGVSFQIHHRGNYFYVFNGEHEISRFNTHTSASWFIDFMQGTSPLHVENSRLAAQVEELTKDRDQLQKLLDMHARVCTAPSSTAAESGDWEKEFDERYFMDLDGHLRIRDGVDGIFSRNRNASLADIKAFIRKHVASPKQAAAVEGTGEPLEVERYRTKQQRGQGDLIGAAAPTPALPAETPTESRKAWRAVNERYMQPANYDCWGLSMEGRMATQAEAEEAAARANKTF